MTQKVLGGMRGESERWVDVDPKAIGDLRIGTAEIPRRAQFQRVPELAPPSTSELQAFIQEPATVHCESKNTGLEGHRKLEASVQVIQSRAPRVVRQIGQSDQRVVLILQVDGASSVR
ncbi:hypothetical protein CGLO_10894 [Colletotrichum gloeosporioides Cg-14]|uniref:Uncharacterized protein n=1 Tax=Colletotrichum gloeosporioides (strain Cg-14) TaxID=1237896 RepID=T0K273_COLGC|nr:hypothetical protein CGLO_10894 [Colletotrichum gloeosporioides Cg-14]